MSIHSVEYFLNDLAINEDRLSYGIALITTYLLYLFLVRNKPKGKKKKGWGKSSLKRKEPWRVQASKNWLREFRSGKNSIESVRRFMHVRNVDHFLWEEILMTCFEERGYRIIRTKMTRDGGADGFVNINGQHVIIQAKRYKGLINKQHVIELDELVKNHRKYNKGLFIHTGKSSKPILDYFKTRNHLALISGVKNIINFLDGEVVTIFNAQLNSNIQIPSSKSPFK